MATLSTFPMMPDIPEALVHQPEPELGYVIGKTVKYVSQADALVCVFGYLNFVDVSNRAVPNRRTTFRGKGMDTYAPIRHASGVIRQAEDTLACTPAARCRIIPCRMKLTSSTQL